MFGVVIKKGGSRQMVARCRAGAALVPNFGAVRIPLVKSLRTSAQPEEAATSRTNSKQSKRRLLAVAGGVVTAAIGAYVGHGDNVSEAEKRLSVENIALDRSKKLTNIGQEKSRLETSYLVMGPLGFGGYGKVMRGIHLRSGSLVAIKQMPKTKVSKVKFKQEVDILTDVGGRRNIVELRDAFETKKEWVIVTELAAGGELFDRLVDKGAYSEREARDFMRKTIAAIQFLHESNIVHGDLKPENIVLTSHADRPSIRLVDFGMSFRYSKETGKQIQQASLESGTTAYSAPEQLRGEVLGPQIDMWSLGVIMYILLTGVHPFDVNNNSTDDEMVKRILKGQFDFSLPVWKNVSPEAKQLVKSLLSADASKRPKANQLLSDSWFAMESDKISDAPLPDVAGQLAKYQNGRRTLRASILAVILEAGTRTEAGKTWLSELVGRGGDGVDSILQIFDKDEKGFIDRDDLSRVLSELGEKMVEREVDEMMHAVDDDVEVSQKHIQYVDIVRLAKDLQAATFKNGDVIIREGETSHLAYKLLEGEVVISRSGIELERIKAGDHFGMFELLRDDGEVDPRLCSFTCSSETCRTIAMTKEDLACMSDVLQAVDEKIRMKARKRLHKLLVGYVSELTDAIHDVKLRHFNSGQDVYKQGEKCDRFYVIKEGEVEVLHTLPNGKQVVVERLGKGQYFPIGIAEKNLRGATVRCVTPVNVVEVQGSMIRGLLDGCHLLADSFGEEIDRRVSERKRNMVRLSRSSTFPSLSAILQRP